MKICPLPGYKFTGLSSDWIVPKRMGTCYPTPCIVKDCWFICIFLMKSVCSYLRLTIIKCCILIKIVCFFSSYTALPTEWSMVHKQQFCLQRCRSRNRTNLLIFFFLALRSPDLGQSSLWSVRYITDTH